MAKGPLNATARIALFIPSMGAGGIQVATGLLARGFCDRGLDVDLVLGDGSVEFTREIDRRVRVVDLSARRLSGAALPLAGYLRATSPTVLIAGPDTAAIVARLARRLAGAQCPVITVVHTSIRNRTRFEGHWKSASLQSLNRAVLRSSNAVVAVSSGVQQELRTDFRVPKGRSFMIPNALDVESIRSMSQEQARHRFFDETNIPVVVAAGRLVPSKDYPTMLAAFARMLSSVDARLLVLGEGADRSRLSSLARRLDIASKVDLAGHVPNPYAYFARADLFVHSSLYEGAGVVLGEALVCGLPIVATDCPVGSAEILGHGRYGSLVPVGDHRALAEAMASSLARKELPDVSEWLDRWSLVRVIDDYMRLISDLSPRWPQ